MSEITFSYSYKHVIPVNIFKSRDYEIYIGRPGKGQSDNIYKNPYSVRQYGREICISLHYLDIVNKLNHSSLTIEKILALDGKTLGCFCYPKPCHAENYDKLISICRALKISNQKEFLQYLRNVS